MCKKEIMKTILMYVFVTTSIFSIDFYALENMKHIDSNKTIEVTLKKDNISLAKAKAKAVKIRNTGLVNVIEKFGNELSESANIHTTTSGTNTYKCSYHCRTDGIFYNSSNTYRISIKARTQYLAENKLRNIANKNCKSKKASGKWMWSTSESCIK